MHRAPRHLTRNAELGTRNPEPELSLRPAGQKSFYQHGQLVAVPTFQNSGCAHAGLTKPPAEAGKMFRFQHQIS